MEVVSSLEEVCYIMHRCLLPCHEPIISEAGINFDLFLCGEPCVTYFRWWDRAHGGSDSLVVKFVVKCEVVVCE